MGSFGFGKPDIEKLKKKSDINGLIRALNYQDLNVAWTSLVALLQFGHRVPREALKAKMENEKDTEYSRLFAAIALGNLGDETAIPTLNKGLNNSLLVISKFSALTLGLLGNPSAEIKLITILNDESEDISIRELSAEGLHHIRTSSALNALAKKRYQLNEETNLNESRLFSKCSQLLMAVDSSWILEIFRPMLLNQFSRVAADLLNFRGWKPVEDREKLIYYMLLGNWAEVAQIPTNTILQIYLTEDEAYARGLMIEACLKSNTSGKLDVLITMLNDRDTNNRKTVTDGLVSLGGPIVITIINKLNDSGQFFGEGAVDVFVGVGKPAILPLVNALPSMNGASFDCASRALVKIGADAVKPLCSRLSNTETAVTKNILGMLKEICKNNRDLQAYSQIAMILPNNFDDSNLELNKIATDIACIIGPEITDDVARLKILKFLESGLSQKKTLQENKSAIANTLDNMGWKPGSNAASAYYWISRKLYDRCIEIGEQAVEPLVDTMSLDVSVELIFVARQIRDSGFIMPLVNCLRERDNKNIRKEAAIALVELYHSGKLNEAQKKEIINQRSTITEQHIDNSRASHNDTGYQNHEDTNNSNDCHFDNHGDSYSHQDNSGIDVNFPL